MKRRDFLKYIAAAPVAVSIGCGADKKPEKNENAIQLLGRRNLVQMDGVTSFHEHIDSEAAADRMLKAMDASGIARMNLLGIYNSITYGKNQPEWESACDNNELLLKLVKAHPDRLSAFVLLNGTDPDMIPRLVDYLGRGARGVKLYNGAANHRICAFDTQSMHSLYRFCELHGVPVLAHVDTKFRDEYLGVMRDYPALPWIYPHLFTLTSPEDVERMDCLFNRFPNVITDICFGFEGWMHAELTNLSQSRDRLRDIFIRHADQIMFGTDVVVGDRNKRRTVEGITNLYMEYRKFLEFDRFHHRVDVGNGKVYEGELDSLSLPDDVLRKIYVENARRFLDRPVARTDRDDLNTVAVLMPPGSNFDPSGEYALIAAAATGVLSPIETYEKGALEKSTEICTTSRMSDAVAHALKLAPDSLRKFEDFESLREFTATNPFAIGIMPLVEMDPRLRALKLSGVDPMAPQQARCAAKGEASRAAYFGEYPLLLPYQSKTPLAVEQTFDPHEIRTLLFTGCSLLGQGYTDIQPGSPEETVREVAPLFRQADVSHVSVENTMVDGCEQTSKMFKFCFSPEWIEALDHLGIDVVELSGNHLNDFGRKQLARGIDAYRKAWLSTFAAGKNHEEALEPAIVNVRGVKFGFTGINHLNGLAYGATGTVAGALVLKDDNLEKALERARNKSDVFFFTYHGGTEFSPTPYPGIVNHSHQAVDAGASGTLGTHAHMPVGVEVYKGAFLSFGLGNFFFRHPRTELPNNPMTEKGLILRRVFYGKKPLGTELITIDKSENAIRFADSQKAREVFERLRKGSRPGLAPGRAVKGLTDVFMEIDQVGDGGALRRNQTWMDITSQLIGLSFVGLKNIKSSDDALAVLWEAAKTPGLEGSRIALPLKEGWSLPSTDHQYDAVRIYLSEKTLKARTLAQTAASALRPLHVVPDRLPLESIPTLLQSTGNLPVIVSGLAGYRTEPDELANLLRKHKNLYLDTAGPTVQDIVLWYSELQRSPEIWIEFIKKHASRILFGTCAWNARKRFHWLSQIKILNATRNILEEKEFLMPVLPGGGWDEWRYDFSEDKPAKGLGLEPAVVDTILFENFDRIFNTPSS